MDKTEMKKPYTSIFDKFILFENGIHWVTYGIYYLILIISMLYMFGMMIGFFPGNRNIGQILFTGIFFILKVSVLFQAVWNWGYYAYSTLKEYDKKTRAKNLKFAGICTVIATFLLMF